MNDKIAKEIEKELRLIRIELQKVNAPKENVGIPVSDEDLEKVKQNEVFHRAGEKVTF